MKTISSRRFRYWVVHFIASSPSPAKSFMIRGGIFITLILLIVPVRASREIVYGRASGTPDLKAALRSMLWLWNRSWVPVKHPLVTYFDIGWILSEETCRVLCDKGFLSSDPLKRKCDLSQYELSAILEGVQYDDSVKLTRADNQVLSLVSGVFNEAWQWAASAAGAEVRPVAEQPAEPIKSGSRGKGFDNDSTKNALLDFDDLCREVGQEYFLVSGTFLGVVREGTFLGHDHDIDLGIFQDALLDTLIPALQHSKSFAITKVDYACLRLVKDGEVRYRMMETPAIIRMFHRSGIAIDLFVHFYDGEVAWHGSSIHRWDNKRFELADYEFLGRSFKGARDFDLYLSENYGADWRTPKTDFDTDLDTPNMCFVGTANALVFYAWMLARAVSEGQSLRVKKYIRMLQSLGVIEVREEGITIR